MKQIYIEPQIKYVPLVMSIAVCSGNGDLGGVGGGEDPGAQGRAPGRCRL